VSEWQDIKLGDVVKTNVKSIDKSYSFETILYLDTGSITEGKIESFQEMRLKVAPSRAKRLVKPNDIIYSTVRPIQRHYGILKTPQPNLVVSTGFTVIEVNTKLAYPEFVYHLLSSNESVEFLDVIAEASTSTYPSLKPSDIENLDISLPPIEEQKAIASVLSSLDDKIDLLHRQNTTLERMAETLFRQWFVEEAQEDWEEKRIGDLVKVIDNRGKTPPYTDIPSAYPLIEVNALTGNSRLVDYSVIRKFVDGQTFKTWFRGHPKKYDSLLSTVGSIGEISMFLVEKGSIAQNVIALSAVNICPIYLFEALKSIKDEIKELDIGSVQPSIKVPHLLSLKIKIPSKDKMDNFSTIVKSQLSKMVVNYHQIQTLEKLRDNLLPKLISGEVRVEN